MATKKQIAANRANAAKSTGPKSQAGKTKSSQNALKHGILSQVAIADHEDENLFASLKEALLREHTPQTSIEYLLVERLALLFWRERRLAKTEAFEAKAEQLAANFQLKPPSSDVIPVPQAHQIRALESIVSIEKQVLFGRYQTMLSNQVEQTLASLRREVNLRRNTVDAANENGR